MIKRVFYFLFRNWLFFLIAFGFAISLTIYAKTLKIENILEALTAFGTCSVVILSVFPIRNVDNLTGKLIVDNDRMYIELKNNSLHTVYLGNDKILYGTKRLPIVYGYYKDISDKKKDLVYPAQVLTQDNQEQAELSCVTFCMAIAPKGIYQLHVDNLKGISIKELVLYTSNGQKVNIELPTCVIC